MSAAFTKATPADAVFTVTPTSESITLSALKNGASTVNVSNYTYVAGVLTITAAYLATLVNGAKNFTLIMSDGGDMTVTVTVAD